MADATRKGNGARVVALRFASLRALRHRPYLAIWIGAFVSNAGTWMETIGLGVFVTDLTGKAGWTGTIAALMYVPAIVLSPLGGALADRLDKRTFIGVITALQALTALALAALTYTGNLTLAAAGAITLVAGCLSALVSPAFTALLSDVVPPDDLHSALSLSSAQYNLGRILGPLAAAAVIASGGLPVAFLINALSFVAVLVALVWVPPRAPEPNAATERVLGGILRGIQVARADAAVWLSLWTTFALAVLVSPFIGLVPVMALKILDRGGASASILVACQGLGAVTAAVAAGSLLEWFGRRRMLEAAAVVAGPVAILYWLAPDLASACAAIFGLGAIYLVLLTGLHTVIQARVTRDLQARLSSLFSVVLGGGYVVGLVALGWLGDLLGLRVVPAAAAALFLLAVLLVRVVRPRWTASLDFDHRVPLAGAPTKAVEQAGG